MPTHSTSPGSAVQVAEAAERVTEHAIGDRLANVIRDELTDAEKAEVYNLYDEGEISENVARKLLGDTAFDEAEMVTESTESILDKDPSRYTAD